jgi:phage shock protein PspC (stress-responsive transcriptional regulator)
MPTKPPSPEPTAEPDAESTTPPTPPLPPSPGNRFFGWLRSIDIRREPGWIGGVCAGIAVRLGIDPLIVRGIAVVIAVLGGPALLLYAAAWLLLPDATNKIHLEEIIRGRIEPAVAGIAAFFVLSLLPVTQGFWFLGAGFWGEPNWAPSIGRALWTIVLIGLLVWFVVWLARRGTVPPTPREPQNPDVTASAAFVASESTVTPPAGATEPEMAEWRAQQAQVRAEQQAFRNQQASDRAAANRAANEEAQRYRAAQREKDRVAYAATRSHPLYSLVVIGLALVGGGIATVLFSAGEPTPLAFVLGLSVTLAILAVGIIVNGVRGKRSGGAAGLAWVLLVPLAFTSITSVGGTPVVAWGPVVTLTPSGSEDYAIGAGRIELDLTEIDLADAETEIDGGNNSENDSPRIDVRLGAGDLTVVVPENAHVWFAGSVAAGAIDAGSDEQSSRIGPIENASAEFGRDGEPIIYVSVQVGAGRVLVVEEGDLP